MTSAFKTYQDVILAGYGTAVKLRKLCLHLYNENYLMDLGSLVRNADEQHRDIAMKLIASYAAYGEDDPDFMDLCSYIVKRYDYPYYDDTGTTA